MAPCGAPLPAQAPVEEHGIEPLPMQPESRAWTAVPRAQGLDIEEALPALDGEFDWPPEAIYGQNRLRREPRRWT